MTNKEKRDLFITMATMMVQSHPSSLDLDHPSAQLEALELAGMMGDKPWTKDERPIDRARAFTGYLRGRRADEQE